MLTNYDLKLSFMNGATTVVAVSATNTDQDVRGNEIDPSNVIEVPTGSTDVVIPLGEITPVFDVLLESDLPLSLKINTSTVAIPFKALALVGTAITALLVSNASGSKATLKYTLKG